MSASKLHKSDVRIQHSLNEDEKTFIGRRRKDVLDCLKKLQIHTCQDDVPNIAVLGSGGGQRAMVGLLGSLVELDKAGLLDCVLYLSGVSGSTWCMASLYQEPDWSTKLQTVKDKIIQRLSGPVVTWGEAFTKLKKYYSEKDNFSLTDVWAVMAVTSVVKEIDGHTLTDQKGQHNKDPFPIYAVIDKGCKQDRDGDPWCELTPYEAGYSLTGAFVKTSRFGSKFDSGSVVKPQPEMDMLYLQAMCGSVLGDGQETKKYIWEKIKDFIKHITFILKEMGKDPESPPVDVCVKVLMDLVDMNLLVLNGNDPSHLDKSIRKTLNDLAEGKCEVIFREEKLDLTDKETAEQSIKQHTLDVCKHLSVFFGFWPFNIFYSIIHCMAEWIWGRMYNFLHNVTDETVPSALQKSETRDYIDNALLNNSPYFTVLRSERNIDLIISLDFSESKSFETIKKAAEMCKELKIKFPVVPKIPEEEERRPKDFYVFKGQNTPTVIHIPLFNVGNCGDDIEAWRKRYHTFQGPYSAEMISDLMEVAGKNISNNREKLIEEVKKVKKG